jgi:hypothetical protein
VIVGLYRLLLQQQMTIKPDKPEQMLPQTGSLPLADAILSSFPRILADAAASRVLMYFWSRSLPKEMENKPITAINVADATQPKVLMTFREVAVQMYHAFSCLDAQPDRMRPFETVEEVFRREVRMRQYVGAELDHSVVGGVVAPDLAKAAGMNIPKPGVSGAPVKKGPIEPPLHTPFNTRELLWTRR